MPDLPEVEWRPAAGSDLLTILDYISRESPNAAQSLMDEIDLQVDRLRANPLSCRSGRVDGTREMVVRPNYVVIYRVSERAVTILRVLHAAQMWPSG